MKILLFSQLAGSPRHGMVFRNYLWAREWVKQGHAVTVVASSFSHMRRKQPEGRGLVTEEWIDGVRYLWVWGLPYSQSGAIGRVISMISYSILSMLLPESRLKGPYDIVVASSPPPFAVLPALRFSKRYGAKFLFDVRDLWPLTLMTLGRISKVNPLIWLMQKIEDLACAKADMVTAVPRGSEAYLMGHGLSKGRFLPIGNGATTDLESDELPDSHVTVLEALRTHGAFIIGYTGAVGVANAMHSLIEALGDVSNQVHLVLLGEGACKADLIMLAEARGVQERVHWLNPVRREQVASFLSRVDITYVASQASSLYQYGSSPTKLNDYLLASRPVVYAIADTENAVSESGCGICCKAEDAADIAQAINKLVGMSSEQLREMGGRGRQWCLDNQLVSVQAKLILDAVNAVPRRDKETT